MRRASRTLSGVSICAAAALALAACATGAASAPTGVPDAPLVAAPGLPAGDVVGQGTVIDVSGDAQLCLGGVLESYPPQCAGGLPLIGWSWDGVDGSETSGEVTWGAYAVQGAYDGTALTVTQSPILLALYDPIAEPDPADGAPGDADEATLLRIQAEIGDVIGVEPLTSVPDAGRLRVVVEWDDGALQSAADAAYGDGVVVIGSALREVAG